MRWLGRWFWTPIRDGENGVQTLVRVIGNLARTAGTLFALFLALVFAGIAWSSYAEQQREAKEEAELKRLVVTVVKHGTNAFAYNCAADYPIEVYVRNETGKTLTSMSIELNGHERGSSTNKLTYPYKEIDWDLVVPTGHALTMCYTLPAQYADLVISGAPREYSIRLEEAGPWSNYDTLARPIPKEGS